MIPVKDRFPPHIYYKVFTHRPVQDVGAFSPRDYTSLDFRRKTPRHIHNKTTRQIPVKGKRSLLDVQCAVNCMFILACTCSMWK